MCSDYMKQEKYLNDLRKISYSLSNNLGQKVLIFQKGFYHYVLALSLDSHLLNEESTLNCHGDYISISSPLTVIV